MSKDIKKEHSISEDIDEVLKTFVDIIEAKDPYTRGHSHHVHVITEAIYELLPECHKKTINKTKLLNAALIHDIGKIETPISVLNKDGSLTDNEWALMQQHPLNGKRLVENTIFADLGDFILYHHERVDGKGYYKLKGAEIPIEARVIAIADTFSALRTYRVYRPAKTICETIAIMKKASGTQLDAELLDIFLSMDENTLENLQCNCDICESRRNALQSA